MPWPQQRPTARHQSPAPGRSGKIDGRAPLHLDINRPGMLHAKILRCPTPRPHPQHRHRRRPEGPRLPRPSRYRRRPTPSSSSPARKSWPLLRHRWSTATTPIHAIRVELRPAAPFQVTRPRAAPAQPGRHRGANLAIQRCSSPHLVHRRLQRQRLQRPHGPRWQLRRSVICHQCLESHGIVCELDEKQENLTVWSSTQAVPGTANALAQGLQIPRPASAASPKPHFFNPFSP